MQCHDPVYFVLLEKKSQATEKLQDRYGHVILPSELYLEGRYLHKSRSRHPSKKKFNVLGRTVYISPGEIFETFVEFDDDLTMGNESYTKYLNFAYVFVSLHFRLRDFFNYFISIFSQDRYIVLCDNFAPCVLLVVLCSLSYV